MQKAKYIRLYADESGESHFEDLVVELSPVDLAPPAAPINMAPFLPVALSLWLGAPPGWGGELFHPSPRRQILCTLAGEYQITASDGDVRRCPIGSAILFEDTWGKGHSTHVLGEVPFLIFGATLADE